MKRSSLVVAIALVVATMVGASAWALRPSACDRRVQSDLAHFDTLVTHAFPGAQVTHRANGCRFGGEAELAARIPGKGHAGLYAASASLDRQGWSRPQGFDHVSPDGRTVLRFRFVYDSHVPDRRSLDVWLERVGARHGED